LTHDLDEAQDRRPRPMAVVHIVAGDAEAVATLERFTMESPGNFSNRGQRLRDGYDFGAAAPISQLTTA